jgi:hypothetical protein
MLEGKRSAHGADKYGEEGMAAPRAKQPAGKRMLRFTITTRVIRQAEENGRCVGGAAAKGLRLGA